MNKPLDRLPARAKTLLLPIIVGVVAFVLGALLFGGGQAGDTQTTATTEGAAAAPTEWTCSMHPQVRQPDLGLCPLCAMDLIPAASVDGTDEGPNRVTLSERARIIAKIQTTEVLRQTNPALELNLLGRIEADESTLRTVTSWIGGRIDRLHLKVTGEKVAAGRTIATLYSPEVFSAHQDLLVAAKQVTNLWAASSTAQGAASSSLHAAEQRLRLLGVSDKDIAKMKKASEPTQQVKIRSKFGGTVIERLATEGAYVTTGTPLYRIARLSKLWVQLDAYETDLSSLKEGQTVHIKVEAYPGELFDGKVAFIEPTIDPQKRTVRVRVEVKNKDGRLRPGMFAEAVVEGSHQTQNGMPLVIPDTAPLFTGRRSLVYVEVPHREKPTYEARVVRLGPKTGHHYPVVAGLSAGERVVSRGAFVVDADLQIRGGNSMMARADDSESNPLDAIITLKPLELEKLAPLVVEYLDLSRELAADALPKAQKESSSLLKALEDTNPKMSQDAQIHWKLIKKNIAKYGEMVSRAESMEAARNSFEPLSETIEELLVRFGNPTQIRVRLAFCPMAMGSRGAYWLQRSEVVDNAYFGDLMRQCGEIKATVEPGGHLTFRSQATAQTNTPAGGHQH